MIFETRDLNNEFKVKHTHTSCQLHFNAVYTLFLIKEGLMTNMYTGVLDRFRGTRSCAGEQTHGFVRITTTSSICAI